MGYDGQREDRTAEDWTVEVLQAQFQLAERGVQKSTQMELP